MTTRRVKSKVKGAGKTPQRGRLGKKDLPLDSEPSGSVPFGKGKGIQTEGVKLVAYKCPTCGSRVRVLGLVSYLVCDGGNKHRQVKMVKGR